MSKPEVLQQLTLKSDGRDTTITLTDASLRVQRPGDKKWSSIEAPLYHVLWAELQSDDSLEISMLAKRKKKGSVSLLRLNGHVQEAERPQATTLVEAIMNAAYSGVQPRRRLKLLVNPHAGPGKSVSIYNKKIEPLLRAARCELEMTLTTHSSHAVEIAKELDLSKFDAVVTMSGDGLIHEVLNGFAQREDAGTALKTPLAPIPAGSGNGLAFNLLGLKEGHDVSLAALNAIKGKPMPLDLFSLVQNGKRSISFMSQCVGLMAELDLWTEHLRFMGSNRFVYGYVKSIVQRRTCPVKIQIKVAESDKKAMVHSLEESLKGQSSGEREEDTVGEAPNGLPPLKYADEDPSKEEGWITIDKPVCYLYAGQGPFVSRDLMQFPVSQPNDGFVDMVIQERTSRIEMVKLMDGAEKGAQFWKPIQQYYKAVAYRVEPLSKASCLSVDGEAFPFEPYQLEVHPGLGNLLSPYGHFKADFSVKE